MTDEAPTLPYPDFDRGVRSQPTLLNRFRPPASFVEQPAYQDISYFFISLYPNPGRLSGRYNIPF